MSVTAVASPPSEQLTVKGAATAASAADLRERIGAWLSECGVPAIQVNEILLVINEALANCVDHAYVDRPSTGTMAVRADFEPTDRCLSICVTDHGTWRPPAAERRGDRRRGRGIVLMHAMAHHCTINGRDDGTTVCLDYRCR